MDDSSDMRIAIDMQGALTLGSRPRGIGRYTMNLVSAMVRLRGSDMHLMLNANHPVAAAATVRGIKNLDARVSTSFYRVPTSNTQYPLEGSTRRRLADIIFDRHLADNDVDVLLATSTFENRAPDYIPSTKNIFTTRISAAILYDLIPLIYENIYLSDKAPRRHFSDCARVLGTFDLLLAISASAKRDAVRLLGLPPDRIVVIGAAVDAHFQPVHVEAEHAKRLRERLNLTQRFIMYVAGADFRKNLEGAVEAFAAMPDASRRELKLLLVTNADAAYQKRLTEAAFELGLEPDTVVFAHKLSDEDLVALYSLSRALVFPSLYEGFGLPVLEAMQCGLPVVVANTSSLPEIVNRADLLYDPDQPDQAGKILHRLMIDEAFHADVSAWGLERAKSFSWSDSARLALDAMEAATARNSPETRQVLKNRLLDLDGTRRVIADALRLDPAEDGYTASFVNDVLFSVPRFTTGGRRLLIDSTICVQTEAWTGIQRVVRKLTAAFYRGFIGRADIVPVAIRLDAGQRVSAASHIALSLGESEVPTSYEVEVRPGDDLFMLDSNWTDYSEQKPLFAEIRGSGGKVFTCIYDLIPEMHPEVCVILMPEVHSHWLRTAIGESDGLICISRSVADEVLAYIDKHDLPYRPGLRVGYFHCGSDLDEFHSVKPVRDDVRVAFNKAMPAFLAVGTLEPRKCHALALDAFELLWSRGAEVQLVFIGGRGWKVDALAERIRSHPEHGERLFWFEGASDNDVSYAYESAVAVISMSMAEGFGLPLAEAARLDKPVICSDIPVFREVGGQGAIYFESEDAKSMADAVEDFLSGRRTSDPSEISRTTWAEAAGRIGDVIYGNDWYRELS